MRLEPEDCELFELVDPFRDALFLSAEVARRIAVALTAPPESGTPPGTLLQYADTICET